MERSSFPSEEKCVTRPEGSVFSISAQIPTLASGAPDGLWKLLGEFRVILSLDFFFDFNFLNSLLAHLQNAVDDVPGLALNHINHRAMPKASVGPNNNEQVGVPMYRGS